MNFKTLISLALNCSIEEVSESGHFSSVVGWDSLGHMRIVFLLEEHLGRQLSASEILQITTIESVEQLLING